jgi:cysteinyl-tRNA synthetase
MEFNPKLKTRFAPSPTGNMHLGNLRAAMMSYLWSVKNNAEFVLRIDDTDRSRSKKEYIDGIHTTLQDFGIKWSYTFAQSSRSNIYKAILDHAIVAGLVYPVYETEQELEIFRAEMQRKKKTPAFKMHHAKIIDDLQAIEKAKQLHISNSCDDIADQSASNPIINDISNEQDCSDSKIYWRFKLPDKVVTFNDMIKGETIIDLRHMSDPVVCKANGDFTYIFASIIDDCIEKVTHIIRGAEHISNTATQIGMMDSMIAAGIFEKHEIGFAHYPLFVNKSLAKLSKRFGALSIKAMQHAFHNLSISHYIAYVSNNAPQAVCDNLQDLAQIFDISCYANANTVQFDINEIYSWQKRIFAALDYEKIRNWFERIINFPYPFLKESVISQHDIYKWHQIMTQNIAYSGHYEIDNAALNDIIINNDTQTYESVINHLVNVLHTKQNAMRAMRLVLTGQMKGPSLHHIFANLPLYLIKHRVMHYQYRRLNIYNTSERNIVEFKPIDHNHVKMYCCGPTLYSEPHIGNYRSFIVFDVIYRLLRSVYTKVTYIRNVTDVDDKIINAAKERNIPEAQLVSECYDKFVDRNMLLNLLQPTVEPTVVKAMQDIIAFIKKIEDMGYTYMSEQGLYFNISKYIADGHNYHIFRTCCDQEALHSESDDFVLWRIKKHNELGWSSPWGYGRPGWHIECTVMSYQNLGFPFDIHCGGVDLQFPHHTNENVQAVAAGYQDYARYWMHTHFVNVQSGKMSKSLHNVLRLSDISADPMIIRTAMVMTHYRSPIQWSDDIITQASALYNKWRRSLGKRLGLALHFDLTKHAIQDHQSDYIDALCDDFNTPSAIRILDKRISDLEKMAHESHRSNLRVDEYIHNADLHKNVTGHTTHQENALRIQSEALDIVMAFELIGIKFDFAYLNDQDICAQIQLLVNAKMVKNYTEADQIKAHLKTINVETEESASGIHWYVRV